MNKEILSVQFEADNVLPTTIPAGECLRTFEHFHLHRNQWLLAKDMAVDLRTIEIHARLHDLRHRYHVPIETKPGPRRQKYYRLHPSVKVLEDACVE